MKLYHGPLSVAGFGVLALALFTAGCGGNGAAYAPMQVNPTLVSQGPLDDVRACPYAKSTRNFNGHPIQAGRWIWFSGVAAVPLAARELLMRDGVITFSTKVRSYQIHTPNMRLFFRRGGKGRVIYDKGSRSWVEAVPRADNGRAFLNGVAFHVPSFISGGVKDVSWAAKFYTRRPATVKWRWGAAVYSNFGKLGKLGVLAYHDAPLKGRAAGTPMNFTQWLEKGGTGDGGHEFVGLRGAFMSSKTCR